MEMNHRLDIRRGVNVAARWLWLPTALLLAVLAVVLPPESLHSTRVAEIDSGAVPVVSIGDGDRSLPSAATALAGINTNPEVDLAPTF